MSKYLVKKQFKHTDGNTWTEGESYDADADHAVTKFLNHNGFIEEVKEDSRWRAGFDGIYWIVNEEGREVRYVDAQQSWNNASYEYGNYFKSEETANKVAEALQMFFKQLHEEEWIDRTKYASEIFERFKDAQKAVLADDKRGSDEQ